MTETRQESGLETYVAALAATLAAKGPNAIGPDVYRLREKLANVEQALARERELTGDAMPREIGRVASIEPGDEDEFTVTAVEP